MLQIKIEKPSQEKLEEMGVFSWPIWEKEESRFDWSYSQPETCYLLEGQVRVEPEGGDTIEFGKGDLVTFPQGLNCVWDIKKRVRKHYKLG